MHTVSSAWKFICMKQCCDNIRYILMQGLLYPMTAKDKEGKH